MIKKIREKQGVAYLCFVESPEKGHLCLNASKYNATVFLFQENDVSLHIIFFIFSSKFCQNFYSCYSEFSNSLRQ